MQQPQPFKPESCPKQEEGCAQSEGNNLSYKPPCTRDDCFEVQATENLINERV